MTERHSLLFAACSPRVSQQPPFESFALRQAQTVGLNHQGALFTACYALGAKNHSGCSQGGAFGAAEQEHGAPPQKCKWNQSLLPQQHSSWVENNQCSFQARNKGPYVLQRCSCSIRAQNRSTSLKKHFAHSAAPRQTKWPPLCVGQQQAAAASGGQGAASSSSDQQHLARCSQPKTGAPTRLGHGMAAAPRSSSSGARGGSSSGATTRQQQRRHPAPSS